MTMEETKKILQRISNVYSNAFSSKTKEQKVQILNEWSKAFQNENYSSVVSKLESHISKNKFAPSISELKNINSNKFNNYTQGSITDYDLKVLQHTLEKYGKYLND